MPTATRTAAANRVARPPLVLDMRDGQCNTRGGLRLTNATSTGRVNGYTIESQRRTGIGLKGLSMRLTAPDGRVLDVVGDQGISAANAHAPVSSTLSEAVGYAFRAHPTPNQTDAAAAAIEAVITTGLECLSARISGADAKHRVQCAARGLDYPTIRDYLAKHARAVTNPRLHPSPTVAQTGWLIEAGFTPDELRDWFPTGGYRSRKHTMARGTFRRNGWTLTDLSDLNASLLAAMQRHDDRAYVSSDDLDKWCTLPPGPSRVAARAGLTPAATRTLIRTGTYDEAALRVMAALLDNPIPTDAAHI